MAPALAQVVGSFFGATISLPLIASRPELNGRFPRTAAVQPSGGRKRQSLRWNPHNKSVTAKVLGLIRFGRHRESESRPAL